MSNNLSIYIHWPFCLSLCPYCDFNSHIATNIDQERWSAAYKQELSYMIAGHEGAKITSIFFGGGTPSLMPPKIVSDILSIISAKCDSTNAEITLEANPNSAEASNFMLFREAGVNRLSLGIQSLVDEDLKLLGRKHNVNEAIGAIETAAKYFKNYSFDLIYGRPNQEPIAWEKELGEALNLAANHISLYMLTIEKATPFFKLVRNGALNMPDNELSANLMMITNNLLQKHGYERYEISNYAKKTYACLHNLCYWNYNDYIGIGAGAHSRVQRGLEVRSIMTHHNPEKWLRQVEEKGHAIQNIKNLTRDDVVNEVIMMGLRSSAGVSEEKLLSKSGTRFADIIEFDFLEKATEAGLLIYNTESQRIYLTDQGMNLHNYIVSRLIK
ncbi:MAG: coproporphyrinogen III oxidase [Alphaproteobacteria bacterium]|nr:coproporphyrinogen III oxidase [Alphaproteobacteria bacterium]